MKRTLVIGTSHLGAVYSAFKARGRGGELDFFALPVYALEDIGRSEDGRVGFVTGGRVSERLQTELLKINGALTVDAAAYDRVAFVGHPLFTPDMLGLVANYAVLGLRSGPGLAATLSRPAFAAFLRDLAAQKMPTRLRDLFPEARFAVAAVPLRRLPDAGHKDRESKSYKRMMGAPEGLRAVLLLAQEVLTLTYAAAGVTLLAQPPETIGEDGFTRPEFGEGRVGLLKAVPEASAKPDALDWAHMNADYGAKVLAQIEAWAA